MRDNTLIDIAVLGEKHFHYETSKKLMDASVKLYREGKSVDIISLSDATDIKKSELANIQDLAISTQIFESLQEVLIDLYRKRALVNGINKALVGMDEGKSVEEITTILQKAVENGEWIEDKPKSLEDIFYNVMESIQERCKNGERLPGLGTGFKSLDRYLYGFEKKNFIVVGARPGIGKTAFSLELAKRFAKKHSTLYFSLEMPKEQLVSRLISNANKVPLNNIKNGLLKEDTFAKIMTESRNVVDLNIIIDDQANTTIERIQRLSRYYKKKNDIQVIIVDYLTLIGTEGRFKDENQRLAYISKTLRILANELDVCLICLSQLNRNVEKRYSNEPIMSDIRDCGGIEQDANVILFLYDNMEEQKELANNTTPSFKPETLFVKIAKNRNGEAPVNPIVMNYYKRTQILEERWD